MQVVLDDFMNFLSEKRLWGLVIALVVMGLVCLGYYFDYSRSSTGIFERLEYPLIDFRHRLFEDYKQADDSIVILTITEETINKYRDHLGRWPWPRRIMYPLIKNLSQAEQVIVDIGYWEPSKTTLTQQQLKQLNYFVQRGLAGLNDRRELTRSALQKLKKWGGDLAVRDDSLLARATGDFLPVHHSMTFSGQKEFVRERAFDSYKSRVSNICEEYCYHIEADREFPLHKNATLPIKELIGPSYALGHISFHPDPDGPARRFFPFIGFAQAPERGLELSRSYLPMLGLSGALKNLDLKPGRAEIAVRDNQLVFGDRFRVPLDRNNKVLINYRGGMEAYRTVSVDKLLAPILAGKEPDASLFEEKTVLVGATAAGLFDLRATPFGASQPGVVIHANVLDMFQHQDFLKPIQLVDTLACIIGLTLIVGLLSSFFGPFTAFVFTFLFSILYFVSGLALFRYNYLINISAPLLSANLTYVFATVYNLIFERQKRRQVREAFQQYLTASVMEEVLKDPDELELGGERREITVLFADIAGFTTFSEGRTANEVARVINKILTEMTECIFRYEGVLDKYIGDEMVAEFGIIPVEPPAHAERAVKAAIDMRNRMEELREQWREEDHPLLQLRIGLHTGTAATGNMGSEALFDYTALGDNVNLGSRLEGANKQYNTLSMISQATYQLVEDLVVVRELDKIIVKGKDQPVAVYELVGRQDSVSPEELELIERFEAGLELYREQQWSEAITEFEALLEDFPEDGPAEVFLERARQFKEEPPPADWDGVYRLTSK